MQFHMARDSHRLDLFTPQLSTTTPTNPVRPQRAPRRRVTFAMVTVNADPYGMPQGATTTQLGESDGLVRGIKRE